MRESDHYGRLWRGANAEGWSLFRIADGSAGKKPADIAGCSPTGVAVLVEVKLLREGRPRASPGAQFPHWPAYELHQMAWLRRYAEAGALAIAAEYDEARREMLAYVFAYEARVGASRGEAPFCVRMEPGPGGGPYFGWSRIAMWDATRRDLSWVLREGVHQ
jgi:hypothetical protein